MKVDLHRVDELQVQIAVKDQIAVDRLDMTHHLGPVPQSRLM